MMRRGRESVRVLKRARVLQLMDEGYAASLAAQAAGVVVSMARQVAKRYAETGLEGAIRERPRPGAAKAIKPQQGARLVAMLCGPTPSGRARWTIRLAAEEANKRGITRAKREAIRVFIGEHALKPWREKNVVRAGADAGVRAEDGGRSGVLRAAG